MGEKTFSKRIAKTKLDEARDKLSRARNEDMKKYWKGIVEIRLDEYNSLNKGGMPRKKVPAVAISFGMVDAPKNGKNKAKMMRGGIANKKEHMYAAGGSVTDNAGLRALKASGPKGLEAYNKIKNS